MKPTFILQKEIIDELFVREEDFISFIKFLKKKFRDYTLITNFTDVDDFFKCAEENPLLEILIDKFDKIKYKVNLNELIQDKSILKKLSKRTIALSDIDDSICNDYLNNHGCLFFNLSLLKNWKLYEDIIKSKTLKVTIDRTYPANYRFKEFKDFTRYFQFCDTLIIFDKYIFEDKTDQRLKNNLYKLLEEILSNKIKMEITIISEFREDEITKNYIELNEYLNSKNFNNYSLNLIHHSKVFYPRKVEKLHSRFILSNYIHIRSNDSFNFFKDNGEFNNLVDIDIMFNLTTQNSFSYLKDLNTTKIYLSKIKNEEKCANKNLRITYYENKSNSLLN
ncbi:hypothetical protein [uncultured Chryseobacterium sp.]|uniref:hypothetical protein n=1 Tax=uncultured Chryseobacterium sp. TaxID=259322 RepID=UPI0025E07A5F|nr:hypothetical protein [uncultured Chryseobacterium sp.]